MKARIVFVLGFILCIVGLLHEKMQFASWGRLTQLSRQLKTRAVRTKLKSQNLLRSIQHGKHRFSSFLANFINRYRVQHIAPIAVKPIALLSPGSLVFTRHKVIQDIEHHMFQEVKRLLNLSESEYDNLLRDVAMIRKQRMEQLVGQTELDFSKTHKGLPEKIRKILYQLCDEYNIVPKNIRVEAYDVPYVAGVSIERSHIPEEGSNVVELSVNSDKISRLIASKIKAILAHELTHIMQADTEVVNKIRREYLRKQDVILEGVILEGNDFVEIDLMTTDKVYLELNALLTNYMEKIADILFASRNIKHAHAMGTYRDITGSTWQKNILHETFEPLISPKRWRFGYPFLSESTCSFINNMEKIWGKKWEKLD